MKSTEVSPTDEAARELLWEFLRKGREFSTRKPSFNEIGLMRYFCDVTRSRSQELDSHLDIRCEMKKLIGDTMGYSMIGRFNRGRPPHCSKQTYITLMRYASALKLEVPDVIMEYYTSLLEDDDEYYHI